jgi:hypothetical protein
MEATHDGEADILAGFRREQSNGKLKTGTVFARRLILG